MMILFYFSYKTFFFLDNIMYVLLSVHACVSMCVHACVSDCTKIL